MTGDPPSDAGATHDTTADASPAVAMTPDGGPGTDVPPDGVTVYGTARIVPICAALHVSDTVSAAPEDDDSAKATNDRFGLAT